jgi:hypothetical protein
LLDVLGQHGSGHLPGAAGGGDRVQVADLLLHAVTATGPSMPTTRKHELPTDGYGYSSTDIHLHHPGNRRQPSLYRLQATAISTIPLVLLIVALGFMKPGT